MKGINPSLIANWGLKLVLVNLIAYITAILHFVFFNYLFVLLIIR
jgi:hypothetical protein